MLEDGDWFRFFGGEEFFKFKFHSTSLKTGSESIDAYGGMPPRGSGQGSNSHGYSWRSFPTDAPFLLTKAPK